MNINGNSGTGTINGILMGIDLAVGEEIEKCELLGEFELATGKYIDDGPIFIVDVTIIDFSQIHYTIDSQLTQMWLLLIMMLPLLTLTMNF